MVDGNGHSADDRKVAELLKAAAQTEKPIAAQLIVTRYVDGSGTIDGMPADPAMTDVLLGMVEREKLRLYFEAVAKKRIIT